MLSNKVIIITNALIKGIKNYNNDKSFKEQICLSTKRLQKLLYLCEIEYMKTHEGKPLFEEEFYAWPSGPVIPSLYSEYMEFGSKFNEKPCKGIPTNEEQEIIDRVLSLTVNLDTVDLVKFSTSVGSPWINVYCPDDEDHRQVVNKSKTYLFFSNKSLDKFDLKEPHEPYTTQVTIKTFKFPTFEEWEKKGNRIRVEIGAYCCEIRAFSWSSKSTTYMLAASLSNMNPLNIYTNQLFSSRFEDEGDNEKLKEWYETKTVEFNTFFENYIKSTYLLD